MLLDGLCHRKKAIPKGAVVSQNWEIPKIDFDFRWVSLYNQKMVFKGKPKGNPPFSGTKSLF